MRKRKARIYAWFFWFNAYECVYVLFEILFEVFVFFQYLTSEFVKPIESDSTVFVYS